MRQVSGDGGLKLGKGEEWETSRGGINEDCSGLGWGQGNGRVEVNTQVFVPGSLNGWWCC